MPEQELGRARIREEIRWFLADYLPSQEPNQRRQDWQVPVLLNHLREFRGFSSEDMNKAMPLIMEEFYRLMLGGILRPGVDESFDLPRFTVTEWGMEALTAEGPPVYDPDAYLDHVRIEGRPFQP